MTLQEVLRYFDGVKQCSNSQYMARCPCHDDRKQSLSIGGGQKGVVLKCQVGCDTRDIIARVGLKPSDLFYESKAPEHPRIVATYNYPGGVQKLRYADKRFTWRRPDGKGGWIWNRQGIKPSLYIAGELTGAVAVCEGEKDADNLHRLGWNAVSGADGAGPGKWKPEYTEQLKGCFVCIFPDNDKVGKDYARETAAALHGVAKEVRLLDLSRVWSEIPEHGDISDLIAHFGDEKACELMAQLTSTTPEWEPLPPKKDNLLSLFKPLEIFPEEEAEWLIPGWIPAGQITLMAADGGVGKTSMWCHIIAALSSGKSCILDPPGFTRPPMKVVFMSTEDSVRKKLKKKLRLAGANMSNIITPDFVEDRSGLLRNLKFGTPDMDKVLRSLRPTICIFDPLQGFTPVNVNMGSRNEMRDCTAPLIAVGEDINTSSLIACHTNKRKGAYGRDRIADSADLWDIARSVMMAGFTEEQGVRYLSNEKNNYAPLQETILFTIDESEQIVKVGTSWKRDREYILDGTEARSAPKREDCKEWVLSALDDAGGNMPSKELEGIAKAAGYAFRTVRRVKDELKKDGIIEYYTTGSARDGNRTWHIKKVDSFTELPDDTETPWTS